MEIYIEQYANGKTYYYYINKSCIEFGLFDGDSMTITTGKNVPNKRSFKKLNNINNFYKDLLDGIFIFGIRNLDNNYKEYKADTKLFEIFDMCFKGTD
jgi:hypothetical protein